MNIKMRLSILMVSLASFSALATPVEYSGNGDYYEVVSFSDQSITPDWNQAENLAQHISFDGVQGNLASVTDSGLDSFLWNLVVQSSLRNQPMGGIFLGGYDTSTGWQWEDGQVISYFNWAPGEPDNWNGPESYLMYWWSSNGLNPGWNDTNVSSGYCDGNGVRTLPPCDASSTLTYTTWGYLVEFDPGTASAAISNPSLISAPSTLLLLAFGMLFRAQKVAE